MSRLGVDVDVEVLDDLDRLYKEAFNEVDDVVARKECVQRMLNQLPVDVVIDFLFDQYFKSGHLDLYGLLEHVLLIPADKLDFRVIRLLELTLADPERRYTPEKELRNYCASPSLETAKGLVNAYKYLVRVLALNLDSDEERRDLYKYALRLNAEGTELYNLTELEKDLIMGDAELLRLYEEHYGPIDVSSEVNPRKIVTDHHDAVTDTLDE